ncbi:MAG: Hsp20/alpha crystallin family protein [Candidatus Staskawiczbacteria bacterium]|nr:Hsp20/alpha crystallin family protein [Candidatus Staskawiczbacteria bacterium]
MVNKLKIKEPSSAKATEGQGKKEVSGNGIFDPEGELVIDVFETSSDFVVLAAIAGIQIKDIDIAVEKDMMVIKGNRQDPHFDSERQYFYQECYWGPFSRKIVLPENIEVEKAAAQMDKGLLTIKIPKSEKNKTGVKLS